ncbi:MAG: crosslink repair DNA glycosylase YcaQ family protein [Sneathiella sp.]
MHLKISNQQARRLWLEAQGMISAPTGPIDVLRIIKDLGFVQLDTIRVVARAHDHILWSRNQSYREPMLHKAFAKDRQLFEHFTHDASLIPIDFYPMWTRRFRQFEERFQTRLAAGKLSLTEADFAAVQQKITQEGPLSTHAFDTKIEGPGGMWQRPPHKQALDSLWYRGELTTSHRENFTKFYDLTHRVIPDDIRLREKPDQEQQDWLGRSALQRLAFATEGEVQRFWDAMRSAEVKEWIKKAQDLVSVEIEGADGKKTTAWALPTIESKLKSLAEPDGRIRIVNPFDPVVRDRARLQRLFGFQYRIEIFVPQAKRQWGYYIYPLLQGDRFVGRMEVQADRKFGELKVKKIWFEAGVRNPLRKMSKIEAELTRICKLAELVRVDMSDARVL